MTNGRMLNAAPIFLCLLAAAFDARAGGILDHLRNYDLNDYALGLALTTAESPYAGADDSTYAYPYLTGFRHPSLTRDWLLIADGDGDVGLRWISKLGWVVGAVGRVRAEGFSSDENDELAGLDDRHWIIELAPLIGWRGWPVQVQYKVYSEISGRDAGHASELKLSYPTEWSWGYLVPSVAAVYRDSVRTDYYFGVSAAEATASTATYHPGSSVGIQGAVQAGYEVSENWLLSGKVSYERLDSTIRNSPIVDEEGLWSFNIGVAYNADVFQPRQHDGATFHAPRFEVRAGRFRDEIDTRITRTGGDGGSDEIDVEEALGAAGRAHAWQLETVLRLGEYHRLEVGYFELGRESSARLSAPLRFGDEEFPATTTLNVGSEARMARLVYGYSLVNDAQKELGLVAGLHITRFLTRIDVPGTGQNEQSKLSTPLPVVGVFGSVALRQGWIVDARAEVFRLELDNVEGSLDYLYLGLQRFFSDHASIGLGYNYYAVRLDSSDEDLNGSMRLRHQGPLLFVSLAFGD